LDVIQPLIGGLVAALVVYLLSRTARQESREEHGRHWVEYGKGYRLFAAMAFPFSAFVTYAALQASPDQIILALVIAALFWVGTLYLAYEFFFVYLSYDDQYIYHQTPLRGRRQIPWEVVTGISYSAFTQAFTMTTNGYGNLSVSPMANGSQAFVERVSVWIEHS
jgi:phosphate/sulfate permease